LDDSDQCHPFSHIIFSTLEDGIIKLDKLSCKIMTTENNESDMDKNVVVIDADITLEDGIRECVDKKVDVIDADITLEDAGIRKRVGKYSLAAHAKALSVTSRMFDIDGDGVLDEAEKAMRDMDVDNCGYLTNDKVYKVMLEQMKLQQEVFGLKRMSMVFLVIISILSLATLGTSFAAATLAKDTNVKNGNLVAKDGSGVVGTSSVATRFMVTEGAPPRGEDGTGRALLNGFVDYQITPLSADEVWKRSEDGQSVLFQRSCDGGASVLDVPICSSSTSGLKTTTGTTVTYDYTLISNQALFTTITCLDSASSCTVVFATGATTNPDNLDAIPIYNIQDFDLQDKVLLPGIYNSATAIVLTGILQLDPGGDANAAWTFNILGTFNTVVNSQMIMLGSGKPANVHWNCAGAITLAANSVAIGDMKTSGAFNLGAGAILTFDDKAEAAQWTFTIGGALTTDANSVMALTSYNEHVIWNVDGAITLGADSNSKGDMKSVNGAITVGARALSENLDAFGAVTLGASSRSGTLTALGAVTIGVGAWSGDIIAGAACTGCTAADSCTGTGCPYGGF
jgi:hypothetical protein